jgi:tRNA G26 N,N-dimethylase Trm1
MLLTSNGFTASRTSLAFKGFRTDACIDDIIGLVRRYLQL